MQFRKLNEKKDQLDVKMIRGSAQILVPNTQIVVGDVIILQQGDKITADGVVIDSNNMVVDEASLTGESEPIKKGQKDPFCRAGTAVMMHKLQCSRHLQYFWFTHVAKAATGNTALIMPYCDMWPIMLSCQQFQITSVKGMPCT